MEWNFEKFKNVAELLYELTSDGGIVVWVVGDQVIKGSESGTSFKQALYFMECGFKLHDTMIYEKNSSSFPARRDGINICGMKNINLYGKIFKNKQIF